MSERSTRALAGDPAVVPEDEAAGALDPATGTDVMAPFAGPDGDGTTLMVTAHDPEAARRFVAPASSRSA